MKMKKWERKKRENSGPQPSQINQLLPQDRRQAREANIRGQEKVELPEKRVTRMHRQKYLQTGESKVP